MYASEIQDRVDALCYLISMDGRTVVMAEAAETVASTFDVTVGEGAGRLQPINELVRGSPNEALGIGIGDLVRVICEELDLDPEGGVSVGHGAYQDELKERNLPRLKRYVTTDASRWFLSHGEENTVEVTLTDISGQAVEKRRYGLDPGEHIRMTAIASRAEPVDD